MVHSRLAVFIEHSMPDIGRDRNLVGIEVSALNMGDDERELIDGGDDGEAMSPAGVLQEMTRAFIDESVSPKLLPHKHHIVDCLMDQVEHMEANIARQADRTGIKCTSHRMEIYRIQHVLNGYLRVRLQKIEANAHDVLREHQLSCVPGKEDELLDVREVEYAESYLQSAQSQLYHTFLANIPESMRAIPVEKCTAHRSRVFIEVLKEGLEDVPVPDMSDPNAEVIIQLEKGSRHLIPFHSVEELLNRGDVALL